MRKSLIALLLLGVLAVGLLAAAPAAVNGQETAVEFTEERHYGDPAAGEGLELGVETTMDGYLHWNTAVQLGPEITWDTDFRYTATRDSGYGEPLPYFYVNTTGGVGTSTSYNSNLDLSEWDGDPFGPILADVASRAPADTEDYTDTVKLSDYMDYYPLNVDYYDHDNYWPGEDGPWPEVSAFFHIPVGDSTAEISVSKNDKGGVYSVGWEQMEMPSFSNAAACMDGGVYLAIWGDYDENGVAQPMPEGAAEAGVYYVPIGTRTMDEYGNVVARVDADGVKLVWQPEDGICVGLTLVDDGTRLLAQVSKEGGEEMAVLDTAGMDVVQTFPLAYDWDSWSEVFAEEDFVATYVSRSEVQADGTYTPASQWIEAWYEGEDGVYEKVVSCDLLPADLDWYQDFQPWCDGERLVLTGVADDYNDPSIDVAVCDGEGLQYAARLQHSQYWDPHPQNRVRPVSDVTVERAE